MQVPGLPLVTRATAFELREPGDRRLESLNAMM